MLRKAEDIGTLLECGCNLGRNIRFLEQLLPNAKKSVIEISRPSFEFVTRSHNIRQAFNGSIAESRLPGPFDMVFTMGVLIHIHPDHLLHNMRRIFEYSDHYICDTPRKSDQWFS